MKPNEEEIILNYLNKKTSKEEQEWLFVWLKENSENQKKFDQYQKIWLLSDNNVAIPDFDVEGSFEKVKSVILSEEQKKSNSFFGNVPFWRYAAVFLFIIVGAYLITWYSFFKPAVFTTALGEQRLVILPDSTHVWLNSETTISYSKNFNKNYRIVSLKGEAFFEVTKNPNKPFIVNAGQTETKVVGTSFNVEAYEKDSVVMVSVNTGKVLFGTKNTKTNSIEMEPFYAGVFFKKTGIVEKQKIDDSNWLAWKTGIIIFKQADLTYVIHTLEKYFHVQIHVADRQLLDDQFSATFDHPTIDQVIQVLQISLNVRIEKEKDRYYRLF